MTQKDALQIIDTAIAEIEWQYPMDYSVAFEMAKNALKRQMPEKVKNTEKDGPYSCPRCNALISSVDKDNVKCGHKPYYCECCGQALDFGD